MAGDWIKFELSTSDKPEVWQIAASLNLDPDAVVGKLLRVWGWFDQQTEEGKAPAASKGLLDRLVGLPGFCDALILSGWMADEGDEVVLPGFDRHNGSSAKKRLATAKRVADHRAKKLTSNANVTPNVTPHVTASVTIPRTIRAIVYARDGNCCVYCGRKEGEYSVGETSRDGLLSVDHVIPTAKGGTNEAGNMVTSCLSCNQYKGDRTPDEAGLGWPINESGERYGSVTTPLPKEEKRREEKNNKNICPNRTDSNQSDLVGECFEKFWASGIRKDAKKKTYPLFAKILKTKTDPVAFTEFLVTDIQNRLAAGQLGFDQMLPTTYLNGERWEDQAGTAAGDDCPHEEIIKIYHEILPECPAVVFELWPGSKAAKDLSARWRQAEKNRSIEYWRWYFAGVKTVRDGYYIGGNQSGWRADLRWLVNQENFIKTIEQIASAK